jgi:hypothetical protein
MLSPISVSLANWAELLDMSLARTTLWRNSQYSMGAGWFGSVDHMGAFNLLYQEHLMFFKWEAQVFVNLQMTSPPSHRPILTRG